MVSKYRITPIEERILILKGVSKDYKLVEKQFNQIRKLEKELLERRLVLYKCIETKCTKFNSNFSERKLKVNATGRNYKTMLKLLAMVKET